MSRRTTDAGMSYWWVNQGQSYKPERAGEYMWAPLVNRRGGKVGHWETMDEVRPGDLVLHAAGRQVRAVGVVKPGSTEPRRLTARRRPWGGDRPRSRSCASPG